MLINLIKLLFPVRKFRIYTIVVPNNNTATAVYTAYAWMFPFIFIMQTHGVQTNKPRIKDTMGVHKFNQTIADRVNKNKKKIRSIFP